MKKSKIAPAAVAKRFLPIPKPARYASQAGFGKCIQATTIKMARAAISVPSSPTSRRDLDKVMASTSAKSGDRGKRISSRISNVNRHWLRA